ncbi:DUF4249 domain-containing protein [Hymenobacter sp. 15J16-1T3B]|uniref:DUF4249 domain-containing protein n=1 Tax=Hymenobacter sp. 15J16-1T3B TaxID=2886941 RepID=UPI001D101AAC|nr:DUF4249 domain-containing protein [Hymenobacter sp. 15J16-1T3B]MCC3159116.1 DUF4249 domain-containing protein [Hymenobacter sp. 15J16-1T3B]
MKNWLIVALGLGLSSLAGCVDTYKPEAISKPVNYLVVDGFINANGVTTIRLSRTGLLDSNKPIPVETRANVFIEEEGGARYPLAEASTAGTYRSASLRLSPGRRVRLYIKTSGPQEYASDFVPVKLTPPIDSLTWRAKPDGVQLYVNTHDETDQARYYRWDYDQTWEFTSALVSRYEYVNHQMLPRRENINRCWRSEVGTTVKLGNTARLSHDVLREASLFMVPSTSEKLNIKYSILVRQYAITPEESAYWEMLNKNTENIGTVFGPLPSQEQGNVHRLGADEPVLGYVGASSVTEKRLFVARPQLPRTWYPSAGNPECVFLQIVPDPEGKGPTIEEYFGTGMHLPVDEVAPGVYSGAMRECVDCRLRGSNIRPSFWQ